ncbi:hypothetical protein CF70_002850 [Cupriavidus sp. SK-3]|uniref:DUF302 domain-containing protein n=1 Tax=Cupriavidus sp. SK-3 TaxID=1470558 RepID=UPI00044F3A2D|nr:DUF302 domain-containing protein [Cupriavidus sp. SK-3]KDP87202.1 hypothetical protein CF70_002850 [Cupriavidus sp. SK-3]
MKALRWLLPALLLSLAMPLQAADGLVTVQSQLAPRAAMDKLEAAVKARGLTVFARIDHAAGAAKIGKSLRPTELLIFGNAQGGTPLMECAQSIGIDLPLKALVWADMDGRTWVSYNDPVFLAQRHGVPECPAAGNLRQALSGLIGAAVAP